MIVMDHSTCMVDVAKYFLSFLTDESCGKCVPCREGLYQMYMLVSRICDGKGTPEDLQKIDDLSRNVVLGSLCALGKSGPNPVLSTIRYFREEYEAHILEKKCPAGVCKELITYTIDTESCNGCGACVTVCANAAIEGATCSCFSILFCPNVRTTRWGPRWTGSRNSTAKNRNTI